MGGLKKMWARDQPKCGLIGVSQSKRDLLLVLPYVVDAHRIRGSVGEGRETQ